MPEFREKIPDITFSGWIPLMDADAARASLQPATVARSQWRNGNAIAISSLQMAEAPDGSGEVIPQWHVSISVNGRRARGHEARRILRAFGMEGAEEDNHHPGVARHFWLPVDPARRVECECKEGEALVTEADGYRWSNAPERDKCRGCNYARFAGRPCPVHGGVI